MGIHYDYKSKRGERAMLKEAKKKDRLALKKAKRAPTNIVEKKIEESLSCISRVISLFNYNIQTNDLSRDNTSPLNINVVSNVSTSLVFFRDLPQTQDQRGRHTCNST